MPLKLAIICLFVIFFLKVCRIAPINFLYAARSCRILNNAAILYLNLGAQGCRKK
jgi:hypothetical protein